MPQPDTDSLRSFEKKMHEQGRDGFADGPRPWEHWDESGSQANNRVWEGSASRVTSRRGTTHSAGHKFLVFLTLVAFTTLLVGIGGVVYTHMQGPQLANRTDIQAHPVTARSKDTSMAVPQKANTTAVTIPDSTVAVAEQTPDKITDELNLLSAPAAGSHTLKTDATVSAGTNAEQQAMSENTADTIDTAAATPVATDNSIESVAIETVVTEESVTTTVYTRHPQQDDADIVAAIETTPPPFSHEITAAQPEPANEAVEDMTDIASVANSAAEDVTASTDDTANDATPSSDDGTSQDTLTLTPAGVAALTAETNTAEASEETAPAEAYSEQIATAPTTDITAIKQAPASKPKQAIMPVKKTGDWVINLSSYAWKSTANRKLAQFQSQGVDAEVFEVMIKDKPMYRIRVTGFNSSRAAKTEATVIEQTLGLEDAWVSKR